MNTVQMDELAARIGVAERVDVAKAFRIRRNTYATHSSTHYASWAPGLQASPRHLGNDVEKLRYWDFDVLLGYEFDLWHPCVCQKGYGPALLARILATPRTHATIVTSQVAVVEDVIAAKPSPDRLTVTYRLGLPPGRDDVRRVIDPFGSPIDARYSAMRRCRRAGIRVTALIDGILPGIGDGPEDIDRLVVTLRDIGVEELRFSPLRPSDTQVRPFIDRLARAGLGDAANHVGALCCDAHDHGFCTSVAGRARTAAAAHGVADKLSIVFPRSYAVSCGMDVVR